jgi:predicted transcriptional regulator
MRNENGYVNKEDLSMKMKKKMKKNEDVLRKDEKIKEGVKKMKGM